ncbi:hypothetical protein AGDE_15593 [Angomonas deanei]|uniref:Uncharacterized protein n=1 Tax=Angomonas deanei TaxID=59799 RepID=A0A7G2C4G4_9TRYP|nr:hypothetical protein AGDE_15593 [Angomonas deanei]CAD2212782.1 hypothetical protein, conserved [Angomonas deanei]|eukprot:EPY18791.1 hypothetical protein AGDE_15593 [Angomonas deanei]
MRRIALLPSPWLYRSVGVPSLLIPSTVCTKHSLFTNQKQSYGHDKDEVKEANKKKKPFYEEESEKVYSSSEVEKKIPSVKQLNDELPSAAELEKALKEGKLDQYKSNEKEDD